MNKNNGLIIKIIIILCILIGGILLIYSFFKIEETKDETYKDQIFTYLTTTYKNNTLSSASPFLGLLNYNFDNTNITLSVDTLINSNMMSYSQLNEIGVNNIYNSIYGISKDEYIKKPNYLSNGNSNCYYQRNVNKVNINCDNICSMQQNEIMSQMSSILKWPNVLPEDAITFCIKNPIYSIEDDGYFVNLSNMKSLYKKITNNDLNLNNIIINNKYYKYDSYLVTSKSRLNDYISEISSVNSVNVKDGIYIAEYTALTQNGKELSGTVTLGEIDSSFYVISNKINTNYVLN